MRTGTKEIITVTNNENGSIMDALLGHMGFVGSHLREHLYPDTTLYFNTANFGDSLAHEFRDVYCACVPAVKWWANDNPAVDSARLREIARTLVGLGFTRKFYLISTIDLHDHSIGE